MIKKIHLSTILYITICSLLITSTCYGFSKGYSNTSELFAYVGEFTAIWDTNQPGTSAINQITIPTNSSYTYNFVVDWGDGSTDTGVTGDITHTYATPGTYTVKISGDFPAIYFNNSGDRQKIIEILEWGVIEWQTMENAFYGCVNLNFDAIDAPDLSLVTSLKNMFRNCRVFNGIINNWQVSAVTDISGMFAGAYIFNRPLDSWNTISVTDMSETFSEARNFNEPLDNWNTASVTTLLNTFRGAGRFNQNINNWDVSQVTTMRGTFSSTNRFNQPLNNWNVANVVTMSSMFSSSDFNQPIANWDVSNVTDMSNMFGQSDFNQPIANWDVSSVTNMSRMFYRHRTFDQPLNSWNVTNVINMAGMFDGWIWGGVFNQPLDSWDVSNVTDMSYMFRDNRFFNQPLASWNVSNVTNMGGFFEEATAFNQNINNWDVGSVTNMMSMFEDATSYNQPLNNWNVSAVTNMSSIFFGASSFNQPLDNWDVSSVSNFQRAFSNSGFNQNIIGWNVALVTNMSEMFTNASVFNQNLANWDITNVTNMTNMLSNSGISQENYDSILIGWATQAVSDNVMLGATSLNYCDGRNARQDLIDNHNWNVTGDIINCSFVLCTQITSPVDGDTNVPANSDIRWAPAPNATGYRVSIRRENGGSTQIIYDNHDFGNVVGLDFTNEFTPGDTVYVTVVPYNDEGPATGCSEISFTVIESWVNSPDAFKLTYDTRLQEVNQTTPINQLKIQTTSISGFPYNYAIDWGDGQYDNNVTGDITHTYLVAGIYTVSIIGTFPAPRHDEFNSDAFKLLSIDQWGTQEWKSMQRAFAGCENMVYNATDIPNLNDVTNMSSMFIVCQNFNGNINSWNVSNVTNMRALFGVASIFNQPLDNWDVSNVTDMTLMFFRTDAFNQNINNWNTGNTISMLRMFEDADAFNQPLNSWNVSSVENMEKMFNRAEIFNQPLDNWDVSSVLTMREMFRSAQAFNQPLDNWDVSSVTNMNSMFNQAVVYNQPMNSWNVSNVITMQGMFSGASVFDQPLNNWDVSIVITTASMFSFATSFNQNINSWNVTNVTTMQSMFNNANTFNQALGNWNVNSVVDMSSMFQNADSFNQPLNTWDVSAVANMTSMFEGATMFNQPLGNWDVSSVTLMASMFEEASVFNQNVNSWNVGVVTSMQAMFKEAIVFDQPLNNWNTGELQNTQEMFSGAVMFDQNVDNWNVSFVTTMEEMFKDAIVYNQPMNSWNVASVATMERMFQGATSFDSAINNWNVRRVHTMAYMFDGASAFNQPLNNWRISNVQNMNYMFRNAISYNQEMNMWNVGSTSMRSMFQGATVFDQFLGNWSVSNVSDMLDMLDNTALTRENYDNTLISWSEQALVTGINLGAATLLYCESIEERQAMIDTYGWVFTDDIRDCPIPECTQLTSPENGAVDVPINTNLVWRPVLYATQYDLTITLQPSGAVINETVLTETYEFAANALVGTTSVTVLIEPRNDEGVATACVVETFSLSTALASVPDCTLLTNPTNGSTNVMIDSNLSWEAIADADGYVVTIGTSSGGNDILNNEDVGNVISYDLTNDLPENSEIFVTLIPYNEEGNASGCVEENFTTELIPVVPSCTTISNPINGATNVPIDTNLSWNSSDGATGYLVTVGITQGGIEIANNIDVGNVTTYDFSSNLNENRTFYVTIIPYNAVGDAIGCLEESFRTGNTTLNDPPACTTLSVPLNGAIDVATTTNLIWNSSANTDGYRLIVGTTTGGTDILDNFDVGSVTTYDLSTNLPEDTEIFVSIIPYNTTGDATGCVEESFTTETLGTAPSCSSLSSPVHGTTNVSIATNLSWNAVASATGYRISIGTSSGAIDIINNQDVGNITTFDIPTNLPEGTEIFVSIIPYNTIGDATGCVEESFTTETLATVPDCSSLSNPMHGSTNVSIATDLSWNAVASATGYRISIGTSSSAIDIINNQDVENITTFDIPTNLPEGTEIFVSIIPYNTTGDATGCVEESFTTETLATVPDCSSLSNPIHASTNVSIATDLSWNAVASATGYRISIGTSLGAIDIINNQDVGNITTFDIPTNLPEGTEIFVSIIPYNTIGDATGCVEESFTTEILATVPSCSSLSSPIHGSTNVSIATDLSWNAVSGATGYRISVGTLSGGTDIIDNQDVGGVTTFDLSNDLSENTTVYVSIIPYNTSGNAIGCVEESFTTENPILVVEDTTKYGFSPDGDGINEFWEIDGIENYPENTVSIYNRWGDMVFKVSGYNNASKVFRGNANRLTNLGGGELPEGTYFFTINIPRANSLKKLKGFLVLKR